MRSLVEVDFVRGCLHYPFCSRSLFFVYCRSVVSVCISLVLVWVLLVLQMFSSGVFAVSSAVSMIFALQFYK